MSEKKKADELSPAQRMMLDPPSVWEQALMKDNGVDIKDPEAVRLALEMLRWLA